MEIVKSIVVSSLSSMILVKNWNYVNAELQKQRANVNPLTDLSTGSYHLIIESKMSRNLSISLKTRSHLSAIRKSTGVQKYRLPSCFLRKRNFLNRLETI